LKGRHQADLAWRFQRAAEQLGATFLDERVSVTERVTRIDAALARLRTRPVGLARVLRLRYGLGDALPDTRLVLRELAPVAALSLEARESYERVVRALPRPRSHDVRDWIEAICGRIGTREATGADSVAIDEVRRGAEMLLREAEDAYEEAAASRHATWGEAH
jgi:hypothetical protein